MPCTSPRPTSRTERRWRHWQRPFRRPPASRWTIAYIDRGYTGEEPAEAAQEHGIRLEVVKRPESERGFVQLPRRWEVERDFAWASRFRRLVKDYERLPATVAGIHFVAFACLFVHRVVTLLGSSP